MSDIAADTFPHLFIWYVAPDAIEPVLRQWQDEVEERFGLRGKLFLRRDKDRDGNPRTTFMETYKEVDESFISGLEALASAQPWYSQLLTPRRCETFDRIE